MNRKLLQKGLRICLMVMVLMIGCMVLPSASKEVQAAGFKTVNGKTYYVTDSGSYKKGWLTLNNKTYYLKKDGVMAKSTFLTISGKRYYFKKDGVMAKSTFLTISGKRYYFKKDGVMAKSTFLTISGSRYYFLKTGAMAKGFWTISGNRYYFKTDGKMVKSSFLTVNNDKYYFDSKGVMATGWLKNTKGQYRYFNSKGVMATGWLTNSQGQKRYFNQSSGVMATGWLTNSSGHVRYFSVKNGVMLTGKWKISGSYYYFRKSNGVRYQEGFGTISGSKYYFRPSDGKMQTGWLTLSGKKYYFDSTGIMYVNKTATVDGVKYVFASDGVATKYVSPTAGKTGLKVIRQTSSNSVLVEDEGRNGKQYSVDINYIKHEGIEDGTTSDLDLLAALCDAEAANQGVVGMQAVCMTVLNRTLDQSCPSSVRGVIYQRTPTIQYAVVLDSYGTLQQRLKNNNWQAKDNAYKAAQMALDVFDDYVNHGKKRKLEGVNRDDFDFIFYMTPAAFNNLRLDAIKTDSLQYRDHIFFKKWATY